MLPPVERIRADGAIGRALDRIYTLLTAILASRAFKFIEITTGGTVADSFPMRVLTPFPPVSVKVVRVEDLTTPGTIHYSPVWCDWELAAGGINLRYVTGLAANNKYKLTLEMSDA